MTADPDKYARLAYKTYYAVSHGLPRATIPTWEAMAETGRAMWRAVASEVSEAIAADLLAEGWAP